MENGFFEQGYPAAVSAGGCYQATCAASAAPHAVYTCRPMDSAEADGTQ